MLGLDTNLTAEAKATGLFAPAGIDRAALGRSRRLERRHLRPFDYALFRRGLRHEKCRTRRKACAELVNGDENIKIAIEDPRTATPGLGLVLWVKAVYGDKAAEAWAKLKRRVLTVTPGWSEAYGLFTKGEAQMVLY